MLPRRKHQLSSSEQDPLASPEDLQKHFAKEMTQLLCLAMHLTGDAETAETCLILAMRDCFRNNSLAKQRIHACARRMVIRSAIRLVLGIESETLCDAGLDFPLQPREVSIDALRDSAAILDLPDLERVAFVICVLERYSILDCALLLQKTPQEVYDAIVRAANQVVPVEEPKDDDITATYRGSTYGGFWGEGNKLDDSCGPIFD